MMKFEWKKGRSRNLDANSVGQEIDRLKREGKNPSLAQGIVDTSEPEEHFLHEQFEWHDATAANEHRKHQARNLVNSLYVIEINDKPLKQPVTAFISIPVAAMDEDRLEGASRTYYSAEDLVSDEHIRNEFLRTKFKAIIGLTKTTEEYSEFKGVREAVKELWRELIDKGIVPTDAFKEF